MYQFPIGIMTDSLKGLDTPAAIKRAAAMGAQGIQMYATKGVNAPENLNTEKRRELLKLVKDNGLVFSAICGDLGMGFGFAEKNPELIEKSKRIMELAKDLECDVVTTHIGVVPASQDHPRFGIMQEACGILAEYADSMQSHFAIETGPEPSLTLKHFLDSLHSTGVAVNLDPANLVMVVGDDPVEAVHNLKEYIVHTHAKDGRMLKKGNPEYLYRTVTPALEGYFDEPYFAEVPLGTGSVNFPSYLKALEEIGYKGFLTIEREVGEDPEADIRLAIDFLRDTIRKTV